MKYIQNIKIFSKNYTLPIAVTSVFVLLTSALIVDHVVQLSSLPSRLLESSPPRQSDTRLISRDEAARIQSHSDTLLTPPEVPSPSDSSSPASSPGSAASGASSSPSFGAAVTSIRYRGSSDRPGAAPSNCSRDHVFEAVIRTANGPGVVRYHWERSDGGSSSSETLRAAGGRNHYSITHSWTITTFVAERYDGWARLVVTRPNGSLSQRAEFTHRCVGN